MTDTEMKKVFNRLLRDENDLNDTEIAIAILTVIAMTDEDKELCDGSLDSSWISQR